MPALDEELKKLSENIQKNTHEVRQRVDRLEEAVKTGSEGAAELRATIEEMNAEFAEWRSEQQEIVKKQQRLEVLASATAEDKEGQFDKRKKIMDAYIKGGLKPEALKEEERNLLFPAEQRALGSLIDADGGALIPIDFENLIYKAAYIMGGFRKVVTARPTGTKQASVITMGTISGQWIGETEQTTAQDVDMGNVTIDINDLRVEVPIPRNLLDDSFADLTGEIIDMVAMKFQEMEDLAFISGNGAKKPSGIFVNTTLQTSGNYKYTGVASALSDSSNNGVDVLRTMPPALKEIHRMRGSWLMSAQTEATVRNLKDSYGQYLYHTNVSDKGPATFDGYTVNISDNCPAIAANAFPIGFGDWNGSYAIRDRQGISFELDYSVYRRTDKVALYAKKRVGGMPVITSTPGVVLLKVATS